MLNLKRGKGGRGKGGEGGREGGVMGGCTQILTTDTEMNTIIGNLFPPNMDLVATRQTTHAVTSTLPFDRCAHMNYCCHSNKTQLNTDMSGDSVITL